MHRRVLVGVALALALSGCASNTPDQAALSAATPAATPARTTARTTVTIPPHSVKVVAVGDIACAPGERVTATTCQQAATARLASQANPRWVLALGDEQYQTGTLADFQHAYGPTWGALKARTKPLPGNHEYKSAGAAGYYAYWGRKAPGYYAVDVGSWRIYLLNSNCDQIDCARERAWLQGDLVAHPHRCSAIAMHHARFSSGLEHGSDASMAPFWRIADSHGVDLALAGHDHDYERFRRMDADGHLSSGGVASFVAGTGGKSLYRLGQRVPGSAYFQSDAFGVLVLWLGDGGYAWRYRTIQGDVRDAGNASCS